MHNYIAKSLPTSPFAMVVTIASAVASVTTDTSNGVVQSEIIAFLVCFFQSFF